MPVYLLLAYIIFAVVPVSLAISIYLRKRKVLSDIDHLDNA